MIVSCFFKNIALVCLLYSCAISSINAQDIKYGLGFESFEVVQDKRTGLNLTPSCPFSFSDGFSLSFDVRFQSDYKYSYGYIFRIIGTNEQHIDFLLSKNRLIVTHSLNKTIADFSFDEINFTYDNYLPFDIQFDLKNNTLNISLKGKRVTTKAVSIKDFKNVNIVFGKCDYPQLQVSDIPKMSIKDIRINNHKGVPIYFWRLSKHTKNSVFDELKNQFAHAENPQWILDSHTSWKKQISFNMKYSPQICYNQDKGNVIISDRKSFYSYEIKSHQLKEEYKKGMEDNFYTNQTVYNPFTQSYYSYFDVGEKVTAYDTLSNNRDSVNKEQIADAYYFHHNKIISPFDSCLYTFGGYGHYKYNNVINKYDFKSQTWEEVHFNGDQIQPRYLSGLGVIDETRILIFGGYGSETGVQELSPQNYYDLYIADMKDMTIKKIWELTPSQDNFVVANSIVVDTLNRCFYALCFPQQLYNTSLSLRKFSMENPKYEILTNNIPFAFQDIYSYADLFLNKKTEELIAITSSSIIVDSLTIVSIYSLAYPPLAKADLFQSEKKSHSFGLWAIVIISLVILICSYVGIMYFKKKKIKQKISNIPEAIVIPALAIKPVGNNEFSEKQINKCTIFLFGGFKVIDKNGNNITGKFSPLSKQLFLIILLNTLTDRKGISSLKLKETLWFDKTPESAINNRGVMLSRLRQIFEQVGSINIENKNLLWTVEFGEDVYCDYYEAIILIKKLKQEESIANKDIRELLFLVSGGEMLPNLQIDWLDSFKTDFSNTLIDFLLNITQRPELKLSPQECIDLADVIFVHDFLNEDAIKLKCKTLIKMGKNGLAKGVYDSFVKEYHTVLGSKFKDSFNQVVS
jgi:two-component SAPR family response regulator